MVSYGSLHMQLDGNSCKLEYNEDNFKNGDINELSDAEENIGKVVNGSKKSKNPTFVDVRQNLKSGSLKFDKTKAETKNYLSNLIIVLPQKKEERSKNVAISISSVEEVQGEEDAEDIYVDNPSPYKSPKSHTVVEDSPTTPSSQESSIASSKNFTFKKGDRVKYVRAMHSSGQPFQAQRGPHYGFNCKVIMTFEENRSSKIGVRFDKQIVEGNDLGGLCEEDHRFLYTVDLLRLDYSSPDDFERIAINELIEVVTEEAKKKGEGN
ncbi:hypothetical protein IEQ34_013824 [Dendrobium chrysotoxum]|uniref:Uncharacterized protein n=1 Tax=Dendrobium chrysotoxum TaxID=161865 RepID=A0AAV7GSK5_DENCH|nr:hypothetical protein IEQ34_013824 [Dendrobium chrysotoxum]